jgi:hypothetical protein
MQKRGLLGAYFCRDRACFRICSQTSSESSEPAAWANMLSAVAPKSQEIALTLGLVVATPYTELDSVNVQVFYDMVNVHGQERAGLGICLGDNRMRFVRSMGSRLMSSNC